MKLKQIKSLGSGGFGSVDLVADDQGRQYARKTFSVNQPLAPELVENVRKRFVREAKVQASFPHRNIVPVLGDDLTADPPFYLMPVAESTLADDIQKSRNLSGQFLAAISDIAAGLEEMHQLDIFHRDLKPQNVLRLVDDTGRHYYAIGDFGLIYQRDSRISSLTTTGMAKGSDYYTAPEVTGDLKRANTQSDIYSLGCILHDMVGEEDRVPCREIRESGHYGAILLNCTRDDPKRRFKSVRAVLDALVSLASSATDPETQEGSHFVKNLGTSEPLEAEFWKSLVEFLEDNYQSTDAKVILGNLDMNRIDEVASKLPDLAYRLGNIVAKWVYETSFSFAACDGIANRLEIFITRSAPLDVKADCLMAMLRLGTSHNRWYVERKFMSLCGADMESALAKRVAIEFRASDDDVCRDIAHLEESISVNRSELHPILYETLHDICT